MSNVIEQPRFSCALGAQHTVLAIKRAVPVVHAGPGCASKTFQFVSQSAGNQGESFGGGGQVSCTNTGQSEVVFGGEEKLRNLIDGALKVIDADLYVVMSGCTSGIVGDDVVSVAGEFASDGHSVVGVETSGFKGNTYFGHELVIKAIIDQFIGDVTPHKEEKLVNVFSVVPYQDPFWRADLEEIKRLLEAIGLKVNILFGPLSGGIEEWRTVPNAQFNLVLNPWVGLEVAQHLKEKYGTEYLHYPNLPVGGRATSDFLRTVTEFAGLDKDKTEQFIAKEEDRFYEYIVALADFATDMRNNIPNRLFVVGDAAYALGCADFIAGELGFIPEGVYIDDDPVANVTKDMIMENAKNLSDGISDVIRIEADGGLIQKDMQEKLGDTTRALVMGSTWEEIVTKPHNNLLIHLSLPLSDDVILNRSFVGYNGGLRLTEEIFSGIYKKGKVNFATQAV